MRNPIAVFLFALLSFFVTEKLSAQSRQIDSLKNVLKTQTAEDTNRAITLFKLCGRIYLSDTKAALEYGLEAKELSEKLNFKRGIGSSLNNLGIVYEGIGDYEKAADYFIQSIRIKEEQQNKTGLASAYANLGDIFDIQGNSEKALLYYGKSLKIAQEINDTGSIGNSYLELGIVESEKGDYQKAMNYFSNALTLFFLVKDSANMASVYNDKGVVFEDMNQLDSAQFFYGLSTLIREKINDTRDLLNSYNNLGSINIQQRNFKEAETWYLKCIELQKITPSLASLQSSYRGLAEVYDSLGDYRNSYIYLQKFITVHDSLFSLKSVKEVSRMELNYEQDKKEREDKIKKDAAAREQRIIFIFLLTIILIVSGFSIFLFNRLRLIRKQKTIIEMKSKEILDSISYAKRLQDAILPPQKLVQQLLPESFIFYCPKDIVAGDFYWVENYRGKLFFAVADCTGHGVPGAMMSIVCSNALTRCVKEFGIDEPGKILDKVRELVLQTFEKSESEVKDGMDISLCCFEKEKMQLSFAGANNSLWLARKNEMLVFRADHQPIGNFEHAKPFTTHVVALQKEDCLFLGTDGYSDQFGGEKGKKFKSNNLKNLLLLNADRKCGEQLQTLELTFDKWKGNLEQVDDVCVMCVKI